MASIAEEQAAADEFMLAETMFADGVEALEQNDFVEASDFLAQSLQFHAERSGDTSVEAAIVALKYAEALLGCARMKGTSILGGMGKKNKPKDPNPNGASTSSGIAEAAEPAEAAEDETGGDEDLELAWEVAETARIGMTNNLESSQVTKDTLTELYQLLGDVCAERELFTEALIDYEQALSTVKELEELDTRWEAEIHFKVSNTMEIMDRGPEAQEHIQAAIKLMSKLVKEKKAELAELQKAAAAAEKSEKPASSEATAAAPVAATEPEAKPEGAAPEATAAEAASRKGAATTEACNDEEKPAEEEADEKKELEEEIKDMEGVLEELQERSKDLVAQKQQEAELKEQLRQTLGLGASGAGGAGTSRGATVSSASAGISFGGSTLENGAKPAETPKTDATAQEGVQDLGVISSKRKRDAKVADTNPESKSTKASKAAASETEAENVEVTTAGDNTAA